MSSESFQWFLIANTAHFLGFTIYTHMKFNVTSLKRLQDAVDWFLLSVHLLTVYVGIGRYSDTGQVLNIIYHLHIEQGRTNRRTLVDSILQVEALNFKSKLEYIVHALQEIHLVVGNYVFLL